MALEKYSNSIIAELSPFSEWLDTTNQLTADMATVVVTIGGTNVGNTEISGTLGSNVITASDELRGGTISTPSDLSITSNTVFNGSLNTFAANKETAFQGNVTFFANATFGANTQVSISGNALNISPDFLTIGATTFDITSEVNFQQPATFNEISTNAVTVSGSAALSNVTVSNTLDAQNMGVGTMLADEITVGILNINEELNIDNLAIPFTANITTLNANTANISILNVSGDAQFFNVAAQTIVSQIVESDIVVTNNVSANSASFDVISVGQVNATLDSIFDANVNVLGKLTVDEIEIGEIESYISPLKETDKFIIKDVVNDKVVSVTYTQLQNEIADLFKKSTKIYVDSGAAPGGNGSYLQPFVTLEDAFGYAQNNSPIAISVLPGEYYTDGNLSLPDNSSIVSTNGQYATTIYLNRTGEAASNNCFLVGSGCYVQGFSFSNMRIDNFDDPSTGFAVAFRPGALILRSPYIRDISQISNYNRNSMAAPLTPTNSQGTIADLGDNDFPNILVKRGGGVLLADRAILNQNSIFPYMLAFGATPRSPNGLGYVAKNGAGINGISSISIFQRCAFYSLNGGQITLNNSGTQFGDISMRAKGTTNICNPRETTATLVKNDILGDWLLDETNQTATVNYMWNQLVIDGYVNIGNPLYYELNEEFTKRDARNWLTSVGYDFKVAKQTGTRNFVAGLFDYKGDRVFEANKDEIVGNVGGTDKTLLDAFIYSFTLMQTYIEASNSLTLNESNMLEGLVSDITQDTITNPILIAFGSLVESLGHQFNLAGAGVNKNALPLNFRRTGKPLPAGSSIVQETGGRVRFSGSDELNNQYFAKGLRVNGRTGKLEGRPFTSSVRRLARRAANSRI
jgi:hypothetical protein